MMNNNDISQTLRSCLEQAFGDNALTLFEGFFDIASAHGMESLTLNCSSRKMSAKFEGEEIDPVVYYHSVEDDCKIGDWAKGLYAMWKRKQFVKPTAARYQKLISRQLESVLRSGFLILDEWTPTEDASRYTDELTSWGLSDGNYDDRYYLLRQMVTFENNRLVVDEEVTGRYLLSRSEQLTQESIKCFFRFIQLCRIVYDEMDKQVAPTDALSDVDETLLERLLRYVGRADWQTPATTDNVRQWIQEMFQRRDFRDFFKGGRGGQNTDRVEVSMANILGYMMSYQLVAGGQKQMSLDVFGNDQQVNNINKGKNHDGSEAFKALLPVMDDLY